MGGVSVGLLDKIKKGIRTATGWTATVYIEFPMEAIQPGRLQPVKVHITAKEDLKSNGIFVDLVSREYAVNSEGKLMRVSEPMNKSFPFSPPFELAKGESRIFEREIQIPANAQPSYNGESIQHIWKIRGRADCFGNDPDSGYQPLRVGVL